jgi:hypothetical protein
MLGPGLSLAGEVFHNLQHRRGTPQLAGEEKELTEHFSSLLVETMKESPRRQRHRRD